MPAELLWFYTGVMAKENLTPPKQNCLECGMQSGGGEVDCASRLDLLLARDFEQPLLDLKYHRLVVQSLKN
jgi:hypothetical protein